MSKKELILHIGTCKTGSSALQLCMAKNQGFLAKNKICYAEFAESNNFHLNLTMALIKEYFAGVGIEDCSPIELPLGRIPVTRDLYKRTSADIIAQMKRRFYDGGCERLIISDECLFEANIWWIFPVALNRADLLDGRRDYIMRYFREEFKDFDIKIVCYLRRQDDYAESLYNQWIKGMNAEMYDVILGSPSREDKYRIDEGCADNINMAKFINGGLKLDYYKILEKWSELYGKENIIVRTYEKSSMRDGIEHDFFVNVLGCELSGRELYEQVNISFKKDIIEYKLALGLHELWHEIHELDGLDRLEHLGENNKKNILKAEQAAEMLDYYEESNARIAREYLGRDILFYDKRRDARDDYQGLSARAAIDISRELMRENKLRR